MKKIAMLCLSLIMFAGCGISTIPPGWEGIKVNNVGARRGTEQYPIQTGRVFFNPINEDLYKYPTSKQNYVWEQDEAITFNSAEGTGVTADVGAVFNVRPGMTPQLFVTYRKDIDGLRDGVIRNEVRDALNREAGRMKVMDIMGSGASTLLDSVKVDLNRGPLSPYILFETVSFVHRPKPDPRVQEAINQVITAMNNATASEAVVRQKRAEAEQNVATARGDSAAAVMRATGTAEANRILNNSLTPTLLEWRKLEKWNGVLPTVTGSGGGVIVGIK